MMIAAASCTIRGQSCGNGIGRLRTILSDSPSGGSIPPSFPLTLSEHRVFYRNHWPSSGSFLAQSNAARNCGSESSIVPRYRNRISLASRVFIWSAQAANWFHSSDVKAELSRARYATVPSRAEAPGHQRFLYRTCLPYNREQAGPENLPRFRSGCEAMFANRPAQRSPPAHLANPACVRRSIRSKNDFGGGKF